MSDHVISRKIDEVKINGIYLTLVRWQPYEFYPGSNEIGFRDGEHFSLIQWSYLSTDKAWNVVKRLTAKGRNVSQIRKVIQRLEST